MGLTYFADNNILNYLYNNIDGLSSYDSILIELTDSNGNGYDSGIGVQLSRAGLLRNSTAWETTNTFVSNKQDIQFLANTESSQTFVGFSLYVSALGSSSNLLFATGTLNTPITVQQGETPIIRAYDAGSGDGITIDFDVNFMYGNTFKRKINEYIFRGLDSLSSVGFYKFTPYNPNGALLFEYLSFTLSRTDFQGGNWDLELFGSGETGYVQAQNKSDLILPLNNSGSSSTFNRINVYYGEGDIGNPTYTFAGNFVTTQLGNTTPTTYTIADGETGRFKAGELRINSK